VTSIRVADPVRAVAAERAAVEEALGRVLDSGRYVHGPEHAAFEAELAAFLGVAHCAGVASGTDALELALAAVGCVPGDEVLTAANAGGYATAAALRIGLLPVYADVDPTTLGLSAATVEPALTDATRAIVATHLYGQMCEIEGVVELCRGRGIAIIEDCAQAAGARLGGRRAGSFGDAATFSFYPTKNLAALGDGGAVVTGDSGVDARVRALRQYGWSEKYRADVAGGWNSRLDELQAAVLRVGLPRLDERNERRREVVSRYAEALPADAGYFVRSDGEDYVAHLAVIVAEDRDRVAAALAAAGIGTDVHYPVADYDQPAWRTDVQLPVTDHAVAHVLTIPCFPELTDDEVAVVCGVLSEL
jgi:dTDP-4-amino-4,6-dideoxygalactose transaminase